MVLFDKDGLWESRKQMEKAGFVCEKKVYDFCLFDMIEYSSSCIDFRLNEHNDEHSYDGAKQGCKDYGMTLLKIGDKNKDEFINQMLVDTMMFNLDANYHGIWIGARGELKDLLNWLL